MTEYLHIILPLATGAIFYMTGYYIETKPPKDKNAMYGYKTPASMKSQKHWDYAQLVSAGKIKSASILMMLSALPLYFFDQGETINVLVSALIVIIFTFLPVIQTEIALAEKFGND